MRSVADCYRKRAEDCRRLATLGANRRDWGHFEEMAATWEKLADLHELGRRLRRAVRPTDFHARKFCVR
jgi:hypothetical protein